MMSSLHRLIVFLPLSLGALFSPVPAPAQDAEKPSASEVAADDTARYEQAVRTNPEDAEGWFNLGNAHLKASRVPESIQAFRKAVAVKADYADAWRHLGLALGRAGQMDEALAALNQAVKLKPGDAAAWFSLGSVRERGRHYPEAAEAYEKAIAADPNHADACFNLAILKLQFGDGPAAALQGDAYLKLKGWSDAGALYMVLVGYFGQRQAKEAAAAKDLLATATQKYGAAAWPFPIIRQLNGETTADELLKAADTRDKLTEAHTYLGLSAMIEGEKAAATRHFRWVQEQGDRSLFEYRFSTARLQELENFSPSAWDYRKHKGR